MFRIMWFLMVLFIVAFAYNGRCHAPGGDMADSWWMNWNPSPLVTANLLIISAVYFVGWRRIRRVPSLRRIVSLRFAVLFYSGVVALTTALVSPIDFLSDRLASVHMIQHLLIMLVAAPLMVVGASGYIFRWALPGAIAKKIARVFQYFSGSRMAARRSATVFISFLFYGLVLWIWHLPSFYQSALLNPIIHDAQHLSFFGASYLFWYSIFGSSVFQSSSSPVGILYLFVTSLHSMALGVLMAYSPLAWYPYYQSTAGFYGLSALQDQQIAGYIMWMPAGIAPIILAGVLLARLIARVGVSK